MKYLSKDVDAAVDMDLDKPEKANQSIYVGLALWASFKAACGERPHNLVIEKLLRAYVIGKGAGESGLAEAPPEE